MSTVRVDVEEMLSLTAAAITCSTESCRWLYLRASLATEQLFRIFASHGIGDRMGHSSSSTDVG